MKFGKEDNVMLQVEHLCKYFPITAGMMRRHVGTVRAVDDVSFFVRAGEVFGLVGESGCGKTTTGRSILRAIEPTSGTAMFDMMEKGGRPIDLFGLDRGELKDMRRYMRMVFQDPYSSLNPRMNVRSIISEPLRIHKIATGRSEIDDRVTEVLKAVGLDGEYMTRLPPRLQRRPAPAHLHRPRPWSCSRSSSWPTNAYRLSTCRCRRRF